MSTEAATHWGLAIVVFWMISAVMLWIFWLKPRREPVTKILEFKKRPSKLYRKGFRYIPRLCNVHMKTHKLTLAILDNKNCDLCNLPKNST